MHQLADFDSHRIEGWTAATNEQFSVPLFSHITDNLYVGGCPEGDAPAEFEFIVSLYPWGEYTVHSHQCITKVKLFDHAAMPNEALLLVLARHVNECRKVGKTLVHCQAGLNRSNLIAALALIEGGMKPVEAIQLLREARCDQVLCNKTFESWLLSREFH